MTHPDQVVVREHGRTEIADVVESVGDYARVEGNHIEGWVEMPDNPQEPRHALVCEDCGHIEEHPDTGQPVLVDAKENVCEHESNARLLRDIHQAKRPSHNPRVVQTA